MNLRTLTTMLGSGLIAGLLASCAPEAPPLPFEEAVTGEDSDALQQDEVLAADGEALEDNAEDGPFPSGGDEAPPEIEVQIAELEAKELSDALTMGEVEWAVDDRDEFDRLQAISVASEAILEMGDAELAEETAETAWAEQMPPVEVPAPEEEELDKGSGPTVGRKHAPWAEGRITRLSADGTVVGWACDRRRAKQPMVVLVSLRDGDGIRTREVVLADETPTSDWALDWVKDSCKGEKAHRFTAKLDKKIRGNDKVALKLVGHDGTRVLLEKRVFRHTPIGAVTRFKVEDREMRKINGWACDMDTPGERVTIEVVSSLGVERKKMTHQPHGRKIHLKCSGGTKHRFQFDFDRKAPCGKEEVYRVFAHNSGDAGKNRVLLGKRTVHGGSCVDPTPDSVKELAQALLNSPNVTFPYTNDARVVLQELAAGREAPVTCSNNATGTGSRTTVNKDMMKFLYQLSKTGVVPINAITDRCHSSYSNHYRGRAVDFACNVNISKATDIAAQHGGAHNFENCANNAHWHFDF